MNSFSTSLTKINRNILLVGLFLWTISSCTIEKRLYNKGYYVSWHQNYHQDLSSPSQPVKDEDSELPFSKKSEEEPISKQDSIKADSKIEINDLSSKPTSDVAKERRLSANEQVIQKQKIPLFKIAKANKSASAKHFSDNVDHGMGFVGLGVITSLIFLVISVGLLLWGLAVSTPWSIILFSLSGIFGLFTLFAIFLTIYISI